MSDILPGEIYQAFDGTGGVRPFIVVSRPEFNRGGYFLAIPLTTSRLAERRELQNCVYFSKGSSGLRKASVAQAEALTMLRKSDRTNPPIPIGTISPSKIAKLIAAVGYVLDAECHPVAAPDDASPLKIVDGS